MKVIEDVSSKEIKLFEDLTDYKGYDFHNNYDFCKLAYLETSLKLFFENKTEKIIIEFCDVILSEIIHTTDINISTIDLLYRGRYESNNKLYEFLDEDKGYFYLSFFNDYKMEFWAERLKIIKM